MGTPAAPGTKRLGAGEAGKPSPMPSPLGALAVARPLLASLLRNRLRMRCIGVPGATICAVSFWAVWLARRLGW
jgi:hypothetical protein